VFSDTFLNIAENNSNHLNANYSNKVNILNIFRWIWKNKNGFIFGVLFLFCMSILVYWTINPNKAPFWTGLAEHQIPNGGVVSAKNLWDWLNLLIVPSVLVLGGWWLNKTEKQNERELAEKRAEFDSKLAEDRIQESTLQSYFDHMTELLLVNGLRESKEGAEVRSIARSRTLTTLRILDPIRKGLLLQFLRESGLIDENHIINLKWANLSRADLQYTNLVNASLRSVNLSQALMTGVYLFRANLSGANLFKASLQKAKVICANLSLAQLNETDLTQADFTETDLSIVNFYKANLSGAHFQKANLRSADFSEANMQDVDLTEADLSMSKFVNTDLRKANLSKANLRGANLTNANLIDAILDGADLSLADLTKAKITVEQLGKVGSLSLATLPNRKD
jgi:uncharacterized protein YjbI with pentapeptide repeats